MHKLQCVCAYNGIGGQAEHEGSEEAEMEAAGEKESLLFNRNVTT